MKMRELEDGWRESHVNRELKLNLDEETQRERLLIFSVSWRQGCMYRDLWIGKGPGGYILEQFILVELSTMKKTLCI